MAVAGDQVGRYRLIEQIGTGGSGVVWRAIDTGRHDRHVALKLLHDQLAADAEYRFYFDREMKIASRLNEPHVIPIHDFGEANGQLYIDMRLVDGCDLHRVLQETGPLSPGRAVGIIQQVAPALNAAHAANLVHGNVKPSNIMLTEMDGRDFAYLIDFGEAHMAGSTDDRPGRVAGSKAYLSPEEMVGMTADHSSDIYALACVLYECLCNRHPFPYGLGALPATLHLPPPRPSEFSWRLRTFDNVIAQGMAKSPVDRHKSASSFADAAHHALTTPNASVFINYRRQDSAHVAHPLAKRLAERLGRSEVFLDVQSLEPGADFRAELDNAIHRCGIMIVLIGRRWIEPDSRHRRLYDPLDLVRIEIEQGLAAGLRVIPALVDGAQMPMRNDMPTSIAPLVDHQSHRIDIPTLRRDIDSVVDHTFRHLSKAAVRTPAARGPLHRQ